MTATPARDRPHTSLRERKKANTREKLVRVATRLFLENGFDQTTVSAIASAADVSQRTVFRYFPTKEAIVFREHEDRVTQFRTLLGEHRTPRTPFEGVRSALFAFARSYEAAREDLLAEWRVVTASPLLVARDVELDSEFEEAIAESVTGAGSPEAPIGSHVARLFAGALFGVIRVSMEEWFSGGCEASLAALGEEALALLEAGFGALGGGARATQGVPEP